MHDENLLPGEPYLFFNVANYVTELLYLIICPAFVT